MRIAVEPVLSPKVRGYCALPYPGHPRGCPNFKRREDCPPKVVLFQDWFDMSKPFVAVVAQLDLAAQARRMLAAHPGWTDRQARCCLYWQAGLKKVLWREVVATLARMRGAVATSCPEGMGMDVTATLAAEGLKLEWPPTNTVRKVAIIGWPRRG